MVELEELAEDVGLERRRLDHVGLDVHDRVLVAVGLEPNRDDGRAAAGDEGALSDAREPAQVTEHLLDLLGGRLDRAHGTSS